MAWNYYFKDRSGSQYGPVSFDELIQVARAGRLAPDCLVWPEGGAPRAARDIPDVFAAMNTNLPAGGAGGGGPLQAAFPVWGLFWRAWLVVFGFLLVIPAAWLGPWFYDWLTGRIRLPNGRRLHLEWAFAPAAALFFCFALSVVGPAIYIAVVGAGDPAAAQSAEVQAVRIVGNVAEFICQYQLLRWFSRALRSEDGALRVAFQGGVWTYLGWTVLTALSIFTIIGWAWVGRYTMRWICRNTLGTHGFEFVGEGSSILWRVIIVILGSAFIIPIPWLIAWFYDWFVSQIVVTPAAEDPARGQQVAA